MDVFYALAEPKRRTIIEIVAANGEISASSIAKQFNISTAAISQHLKVLKETKLLLMRKNAQQRIYRVNPVAISEIEDWARQTTILWNKRFDNLDRLLKVEKIKGGRNGKQ